MMRLLVHVEGQTEEDFVKKILRDHLVSGFGYASVNARQVGDARQRMGRGGARKWPSVHEGIVRHLKEDSGSLSTMMVDFYGMRLDWPGRRLAGSVPFAEKAPTVEAALAQDIASERFIPYVVMHEFEGLLFSNPTAYAEAIENPGLAQELHAIRIQFATPEEINDSPEMAPSKRVKQLAPQYQKPIMGVRAVERIGLTVIRRECPLFDRWVQELERRGTDAAPAP